MESRLTAYFETLDRSAAALRNRRITELFATEPDRMARFVLEAACLRLDLSKNLLDDPMLTELVSLAEAAGVRARTAAMFRGDIINTTEQRAVLHTALRRAVAGVADVPYAAEINAVYQRIARLVDDVHAGRRTGYSGERFTDVVNIGIGGSHLGPQLACDALRYARHNGLNAHFLANVDGGEFDRITTTLNPDTTLFIVASKSFTTVETRLNAMSARAWLAARRAQPEAISAHFVAVSANPPRAVEFGIAADNVFPMWDWVGGRYSMWSAIGLPIALKLGMDVFRELLNGAATMDAHFLEAPLARNMPVLLAMLGIWNTNALGAQSYAVIPYDDRLRYLPDYLQQLEMESNGKRVSLAGTVLERDSAPVTWGGLGTNAQHAFFQLLHQGTRFIPIDFIVAMQHPAHRPEHHAMLVANCLAQAEGLMSGRNVSAGQHDSVDLSLHRESPGNRPSSTITMDALTPATLGALIALYEHKTFVQSVVWGINAFDQWGVELGKELATTILQELDQEPLAGAHDPSTAALIARFRALNAAS